MKILVPSSRGQNLAECWYVVGLSAKLDAQLAAQKHLGSNDAAIFARRPLSFAEIENLSLKPVEVRQYDLGSP
jgi:hypothetical protein